MLTVLRHGNRITVRNPITQDLTEMINVVFVEEGRTGAIASMAGSSDFLSKVAGVNVGLSVLRTHTHPVIANQIDKFPVGRKIPGHINRKLFSTPQIEQQVAVQTRMVDGKPTFFTTYLDEVEKPDEDYRMTNETLAQLRPEFFTDTRVRVAEVEILGTQAVLPVVGTETLAQ